jgi:hypothetical protein
MSSIEHRFRPIKEQGRALREAVAKGIDPKEVDIFDKSGMVFYRSLGRL